MAVEHYPLELAEPGGGLHPAVVFVSEEPGDQIRVAVRWAGGDFAAAADDAFTAFCAVREQLAGLELMPRCYGTCRNLILSGMCYQMGSGLSGYLVRLGHPARQQDLVRIFKAGPDMDLVFVAEQQEFKQAWLRSLGIDV